MSDEPKRRDWLLYQFRTDLREAVTAEGKKAGRTAPKQLEEILAERYNLPALSGENEQDAREIIKSKAVKTAAKRPKKSARKSLTA